MVDGLANNLSHYLDLLSQRQRLVAANIANADTPDFKTRDLDFHFEFTTAAQGQAARPIEVEGLPLKNDGNNVSLDREARLLAENALRFNMAASLLRGHLHQVRSAIKEGQGA